MLETLVAHIKPQPSLAWVADEPTEADMNHLIKEATEESRFDPHRFRATMLESLRATPPRAKLLCYRSSLAMILAIVEPGTEIPFEEWGRIFQAFGPYKTPYRILWFAHPQTRVMPAEGPPQPGDICGGYAYPCQPETIVIYRKEEASRVLVHELLHASCTDDMNKSEPIREALTETWAELFLIAVRARGHPRTAAKLWAVQAQRIADQEALLTERGVTGPEEFSWRYLVARRKVLEALRIPLPPSTTQSLRMLNGSLSFTQHVE